MEKLIDFCTALNTHHVRYEILVARDDAAMVTVVIPGQYIEVEFFRDGSVELERFHSQGVEEGSDAALEEIIQALSS